MTSIKQIDIKAIFEKNAGHPVDEQKKTIIHVNGKAQVISGDFRPKSEKHL